MENAMLNAIRSRLTYANVMATGAMFVALGGGAYALTGIPDRSGIYHGCVASTGALRVVARSSSCRKAKTVRRGGRRVRIPGESAIAWNQQGRPGIQGVQGIQGSTGQAGATNVTVRQSALGSGDVTATCNAGERAVGGGANVQSNMAHIDLSLPVDSTNNAPVGQAPTAWRIRAHDNAGNPATVQAFVVCASP
jgi:hypothetical protein